MEHRAWDMYSSETVDDDNPPGEVDSTESSDDESKVALREDVEKICLTLADRIEANGSKRPNITKRWRDSARRMIDLDKRTLEQVLTAIDWCQNDEFWHVNVLSVPTLREKYDQLRLAAMRERRALRAAPRQQQETDAQFDRAMARAAARDEQAELPLGRKEIS